MDGHGEVQPLVETNVLPGTFESASLGDARLWQAAACCAVGFLAIFCIERIAVWVSASKRK